MTVSETETVTYDLKGLTAFIEGLRPVSNRFMSNLKESSSVGKHARLDLSDGESQTKPRIVRVKKVKTEEVQI
jgi:hypothetical protein